MGPPARFLSAPHTAFCSSSPSCCFTVCRRPVSLSQWGALWWAGRGSHFSSPLGVPL